MATIVVHRETDKKYILIGTGYAYFQDSRPSFIGGTLFPHQEEGEMAVVAVSDEGGNIEWFDSDDIQVIEIDGIRTKDLLVRFNEDNSITTSEGQMMDEGEETCPGCGVQIKQDEKVCPTCGLTLID